MSLAATGSMLLTTCHWQSKASTASSAENSIEACPGPTIGQKALCSFTKLFDCSVRPYCSSTRNG